MNAFSYAFNLILYQPLFNALILLYLYLPGRDFGIAVIVLTILTKVIFYPLGAKAIRSQKNLQELQPKLQEIQSRYKEEKERQVKETMELYKREKINPFSGCLPLLIQLPILIALYQVFWKGLQPEQMANLYSFVANPGTIDPTFFGIINLSKPNIYLAVFAGISQFVQTKMTSPKSQKPRAGSSQMGEIMQKQMLYFFPAFTVLILWNLPSAIGLYWLVSTIFSIIQQYLIFRPVKQI
jgi:YidC/Oxa1 family membrane protein insertase